MKKIFLIFFLGLCLATWQNKALAQQTVFNVPSADVMDKHKLYFENDWYFRPWETDSDTMAVTYFRGVIGVVPNLEAGLNLGAFDLQNPQNPFIDVAVKWRPLLHEFSDSKKPSSVAFYVGTNSGVGLNDAVAGEFRSLVYGALALRAPEWQTRLGVGPYFATEYVFGEDRPGVMATFEQPLPFVNGLSLAADWFSGDGAALTPGLIYSHSPITLYLGYGFANTGRADDLLTFEIGFSL